MDPAKTAWGLKEPASQLEETYEPLYARLPSNARSQGEAVISMATLADELLNDFEDSGSEAGDDGNLNGLDAENDGLPADGAHREPDGAEMLVDDADEDEDGGSTGDHDMTNGEALESLKDADDAEEAKARAEKMQLGGVSDVRSVAILMKTLEPILQKISFYQSLPPEKQTTLVGNVEDNPEYHLLTQANNLSASIDTEIVLVHKFIRDHYSARFPELETLVTGPLDYAKAVAIIGNGPMNNIKELSQRTDNLVNASLKSVLDGPTMMVVTVEATTTRGREMSPSELRTVIQACEMTFALDRAKRTLSDYVQSRMNDFAPNLTVLIGPLTAAQLLNATGGLARLAETPDRNLPSLGSKKQLQSGRATNVHVRRQGFVYQSPIVRRIPEEYKKQAMRIVSAKIVLAARHDLVRASLDGSEGAKLKDACHVRLEKLTEATMNRGPRAIPAPDEKPSRKRGGRRARKAKEATALTDIRKAQNRMAFGKEEQEVGYGTGETTKGLGMIGQANVGKIRALQVDQRTRAKLSKSNKGWGTASSLNGTASTLGGFGLGAGAGNASVLRAHGLRSSGVGGAVVAGTASSISFTPVQGLELVNPEAQRELKRKREADEDRWFKGGTFTQVGGGSSVTTNGSFKVPAVPPAKAKQGDSGSMGPPPPKRAA